MKNRILSLLLAGAILTALSCKKQEVPEPPVKKEPPTPYGTPFATVPAPGDVVMYEVNLRAFSSSGDIAGVIRGLDNISSLGVNVLWLMPIHPVGEVNSVNSPYSVKDYKSIGEEYGTLADLRRLTDSAHSKNMAVIMDWVANHTAWDNPWISRKEWYSQDAQGNIIHPPGTNWLDVADLNYDNMEMQNAMIAAMKYWVWEANIDGFRCDYADGVPASFWKRAIDTLKSMQDRSYVLLAEGSRKDHFSSGFDLLYGWNFYGKTKGVFNGENAGGLYSTHLSEYSGVPTGKHILRYTTNHDQSAWEETPMVLFNGEQGALAASVATIFMGGVPLLYTGQEVGTVNNVPFFSNSLIDWDGHPEMLLAYEEMMAVYSRSPAARTGSAENFTDPDVICFRKTSGSENILVLVNTRNEVIDYSVPAELQESDWKDAFSEDPVVLGDAVTLGPYGYLILE